MKLKVNPAKKQDSDFRKWKSFRNVMSGSGKRKTSFKIFLAFIIIFLFYSSAMFTFGVLAQRNLGFSNFVAKPILMDNFDILVRYVNSMFVQPEVLNIDITYKNYQKLEYARACALTKGTTYGILNEWVNARIRYNDQAIPAKIRLKGGTADEHCEGEKWSFRVKIKKGKTLFGMKEFAVMSPMRRNLLGEWFIRKVYGKEGIIARKYEFAEIIINGYSKGIYAIDERYDHRMLERNQRKEGPVFKIEVTPIFVEKLGLNPSEKDDYYYTLDWTVFDQDKLLEKNDSWKKQIIKAKDLLERFRSGLIAAHEVFDIEKMAKWMAIGDVMGAWHGFSLENMRFYYNPIISKFEPVPDDHYNERSYNYAAPHRLFRLNDTYNKGKFLKQLFSDFSFTEAYLREMERVSTDTYLNGLFAEFNDEIKRNSYILAKDYPLYNFLLDSKTHIYGNAKSLRDILNPYKGVQAYFQKRTRSGITLKTANNKSVPMEILYISKGDKETFKPQSKGRIILDGRDDVAPVKYREFEFEYSSPEAFSPDQISEFSLAYRILGTSTVRTTEIFPFPAFDGKRISNDLLRRKPNAEAFPFLTLDPKKKEFTFKRGHHRISKDMIIPAGHTLIAHGGTRIDLSNSAMILSYSPIIFSGLESRPVTVTSSDRTGQGITVIKAHRGSLLKQVLFQNLSCPLRKEWELTGAVNFYESPVRIDQAIFENNISGDDYINLVRSEFMIDGLSMNNTFADALDIDFGKGKIQNSNFTQCGTKDPNGDCLDISGSVVEIENIRINGSGDKGISIGENSSIDIHKSKVKNAKIAVASKDNSTINISGLSIDDCQTGFAAYQKKREFGPASIKVQNLSMSKVGKPYLVEEGSSLLIDGKKMKSNSRELKKLLYETNE